MTRKQPIDPHTGLPSMTTAISSQECYTLDILYGAGSLNHVIGDVIFHCHLYPHFMEGMWILWRIYDRLQDGTGELPDGTLIRSLMPLKDRESPPKKDKMLLAVLQKIHIFLDTHFHFKCLLSGNVIIIMTNIRFCSLFVHDKLKDIKIQHKVKAIIMLFISEVKENSPEVFESELRKTLFLCNRQ